MEWMKNLLMGIGLMLFLGVIYPIGIIPAAILAAVWDAIFKTNYFHQLSNFCRKRFGR